MKTSEIYSVGTVYNSSHYSLECVLSILIVGFLWGATNPLLRLGSRSSPGRKGELCLTALFLNWRFSVPLKSSLFVMFIYLVSTFPVSVIVPCVNALQFVFTAIVGHLIGKRLFQFVFMPKLFGMILIDQRKYCFRVVLYLPT
ncbi:unnamed protein product [Angiostrongylus costaricensis]|uniref:Transmembrane protein 234 homolog n=1 Tax=Angiostrongylus costaricensis TaxID=334426 RepID=A0A0R3PKM6_ANGCS|nr:unnamed protein product [Angiostrongylus costaricensis]